MKGKISLLAALLVLSIGLSSAITIEIDIFNFGGEDKDNATQSQQQNQSDEPDTRPGRDTTVEEQEPVDPSEQNNMGNDPITGGGGSQGLGSMIKDLISSFL